MTVATRIRALLGIVVLVMFASTAWASSSIFDGEIVKVEEDTIHVRMLHSPYTSVPEQSRSMTDKDGDYRVMVLNLDRFKIYFLDEIPVTKEQLKTVLKPGMRMATSENRNVWYFLYVTTRNLDTKVGFIKAVDGDTVTLERPQMGAGSVGVYERKGGKKQDDGYVHLTYKIYPHLETKVKVAEDAVVTMDGKSLPWSKAKLTPDPLNVHADPKREGDASDGGGWTDPSRGFARSQFCKRNAVLVQAPRLHVRVELIPAGYGDWATLVNEKRTKPQYTKTKGMEFAFLGVVTSGIETRDWDRYPHKSKTSVRKFRGFGSYMLAGKHWNDENPFWRGINKSEAPIVDGYFVSNMECWRGDGMAVPGRLMLTCPQRGRPVAGKFIFSSENPAAYGVITEIDGNRITVEAPVIKGVPIRGKQMIEIPDNAETFSLGKKIARSKVLKKGNIIQVYAARPQTWIVNAGR